RLVRAGEDGEAILAGVVRYAAWTEATGNAGTEFVKQIPTFLNGRFWCEEWTLPAPAAPRVNGHANGRGRHDDDPPVPLALLVDRRVAEWREYEESLGNATQ